MLALQYCNRLFVIFLQRNRQMKEKDFSGADLPFPLFLLETNVHLAFLTLIEGQKFSKERPRILFLSLILPQTLLFTQPTKFYPSRQRNLARMGDLHNVGLILQVRKWLFYNYLFQDRLDDNQSMKQIQRLGIPCVAINTQRYLRSGESHHISTS